MKCLLWQRGGLKTLIPLFHVLPVLFSAQGQEPSIVTQPQSRGVFPVTEVTFSVEAAGQTPLAYQWRRNTLPLPNATNASLTLLVTNTSQAGSFDVVITNDWGSVTSTVALLVVVALAPEIARSPGDQLACSGDTATLSVLAQGVGVLAYQWRHQGQPLPRATNAQLTLENVQLEHAGDYDVVVTNLSGSITSSVAKVIVDPPFPIVQKQPVDREAGESYPVALAFDLFYCKPLSHQWHRNGVPVPGADQSRLEFPAVRLEQSGVYEDVVTGAFGSLTSAPVSLVVTQTPPRLTLHPRNNDLRYGQRLNLTAEAKGSPPLNWRWVRDGEIVPGAVDKAYTVDSVSTNHAGHYYVVVANALGAATSSLARVTVEAAAPTLQRQPFSEVFEEGYPASLSVDASGLPSPTFQWQFNGKDIPGATSRHLYFPSVSPEDDGDYCVLVRNPLAEVKSDTARITVASYRPRNIILQPLEQTVSGGQTASFEVAAEAAPPPTYQWRHNGRDLPGETNQMLVIPNAGGAQAGYYTVLVRNRLGARISPTARLTVDVIAPSFNEQPVSQGVVPGAEASLEVDLIAAPRAAIQWFHRNIPIPGATNETLDLPAAGFSLDGSYHAVARNEAGRSVSEVAVVRSVPPGPLDAWTWRRPLPQGNDLFAVTPAGDRWVAVGRRGARLISSGPDPGSDWVEHNHGPITFRRVAHGDGRFVAVTGEPPAPGAPTSVWFSPDGVDWTEVILPAANGATLVDAAAGADGMFVVVGTGGVLLVSQTGMTWTRQPVEVAQDFFHVSWDGARFLAVTQGFDREILFSPDGSTWTRAMTRLSSSVRDITHGDGLYVAVGSYYDDDDREERRVIYTSTDAVQWSRVSLDAEGVLVAVAHDGRRFVAVGGEETGELITSPDGFEWTDQSSVAPNELYDVACADSRCVAVGNFGNILVSTGEGAWSFASGATTRNLRGLATAQGRTVAVGNKGLFLVSGQDETWIAQPDLADVNVRAVDYGNGRWVAVGDADQEGTLILTSPDGRDWSRPSLAFTHGLYDVIFAADRFVAVGSRGLIVSSTDGETWQREESRTMREFNAVTWGRGRFVAVGAAGTVVYSRRPGRWEHGRVPSNFPAFLQGVTAGPGFFIAGGRSGALLRSTDGRRWKRMPSPFASRPRRDIEDLIFAHHRVIAVGERGLVASSRDGRFWTRHRSGIWSDLRRVRWNGERLTVVGNNETILTAPWGSLPPRLQIRHQPSQRTLEIEIEFGMPENPGAPRRRYRLQVSSDLRTWKDLKVFRREPGTATLVHPVPSPATSPRFYRVVED